MKKCAIHIAAFLACILICCYRGFASDRVGLQHLRCEMLENPQGIDALHPRLSWQIISSGHNTVQTAYQVIVASSLEKLNKDEGDLWDSHKISSNQSIMVAYAGKALASRTACFWKVRVWTNTGQSQWGQSAFWSTGLLNASDWKAKWIGYDGGFPWDSVSKFSRLSARYFRKEFKSDKPIEKAVVYIVGLGHYELYVNGKAVGDEVLAETPTDYTKAVKYNTYDVTDDISQGDNVIGTVLGNGRFFTMRPKYKPQKIKEFGFPKMLLQLEITYNDGSKKVITSDDSWKFTGDGPIRSNNEYDGEEYDATKELTGWSTIGYDDSMWSTPQLVAAPGGRLEARMMEPIKIVRTIDPISIRPLRPGIWIMDMGQNMAGWVQMRVKGNHGDKVTLRYAETLQKDRELYVANLRDAKATDRYTLKGRGEEIWHPVFVFHGFRYVEITGYPGTPNVNDFVGQVVSDDMANIGQFETSDTLINRIYKNAWWGILSNYKGMPIDCPQRNERMPWLGDRATGSLGESFVFNNENLYAKWLDDIRDAQLSNGSIPDVAPAYWHYYSDNMTWPGTYILVADMLYGQFGDKAPVEKHYASMKKWLSYMGQKYLKNGLMTKDKYGDWCVPPESLELIHAKDPSRITDGTLIATAYYYRMLCLMQRFAEIVNKPADQKSFSETATATKEAFNQKFLNKNTGQYDNNTVTANLLPLYFGMVPPKYQKQVFNNIVNKILVAENGHISTGVIGTQWLMRGLTDYGRPDLAFHIANNSDYPSWGYMVKQGATTIWELWNGDTANPQMNSRNHVMLLGDLITWFYQGLAGIKAGDPGFKTIIMKPAIISGLDNVKASYQTPYGLVKSSWKKNKDQFEWKVTVPPNATATVYLPTKTLQGVRDGDTALSTEKEIKYAGLDKDKTKIVIGSGDYDFKIKY